MATIIDMTNPLGTIEECDAEDARIEEDEIKILMRKEKARQHRENVVRWYELDDELQKLQDGSADVDGKIQVACQERDDEIQNHRDHLETREAELKDDYEKALATARKDCVDDINNARLMCDREVKALEKERAESILKLESEKQDLQQYDLRRHITEKDSQLFTDEGTNHSDNDPDPRHRNVKPPQDFSQDNAANYPRSSPHRANFDNIQGGSQQSALVDEGRLDGSDDDEDPVRTHSRHQRVQPTSGSSAQPSIGDEDTIHRDFSMVIYLDGQWHELECYVCGANGPKENASFFKGVSELLDHVSQYHPPEGKRPLNRKDTLLRGSQRVFGPKDVSRLEAGQQPLSGPIVKTQGRSSESYIYDRQSLTSLVTPGQEAYQDAIPAHRDGTSSVHEDDRVIEDDEVTDSNDAPSYSEAAHSGNVRKQTNTHGHGAKRKGKQAAYEQHKFTGPSVLRTSKVVASPPPAFGRLRYSSPPGKKQKRM